MRQRLTYVRTPVGKTSAPLYSYFALVADDPSVQIVIQAQTWYIKDMLKDTEYKDLPVLSAAAPFKAGGRGGADYYTDVPAGDIAIKNVADLYLYPEHGAGGRHHRRAGEELAGNVGRHVQSDRGRRQGRSPAQQRFSVLQFRRHRRRHLPDRPVAAAEVSIMTASRSIRTPTASRTCLQRQADRSGAEIRRRLRTITAPAAAASSRRSPPTRWSSRRRIPTATSSSAISSNRARSIRRPTATGPSSRCRARRATFESGPKARQFLAEVKSVKIEDAGEGADGFSKFRLVL